jgi:hypothetical protein
MSEVQDICDSKLMVLAYVKDGVTTSQHAALYNKPNYCKGSVCSITSLVARTTALCMRDLSTQHQLK